VTYSSRFSPGSLTRTAGLFACVLWQCQQMNIKLQTVQPEFLAKLLQDVEKFKTNVDDFVEDYTDRSLSETFFTVW